MIFERKNGALKRISTNGNKGGIAELTMAYKELAKEETRQLLEDSQIPFVRDLMVGFLDNGSALRPEIHTTPAARKRTLDASTMLLLLNWLNSQRTAFSGSYRHFRSGFEEADETDIFVNDDAAFIRTLYIPASPIDQQIAGCGFDGSQNKGNTFVMLTLEEPNSVGSLQAPAQVVWIFDKYISMNGRGNKKVSFIHVRLLNMIKVSDILDDTFPHIDLFRYLRLTFAKDDGDEDREERLATTDQIISQLAIVPFNSPTGSLLGVKQLM